MFYSVLQTAKMAGVSRITTANVIRAGKLKAIKVGRAYIIAKEDAEIYIEAQKSRKQRA